MNKKKALRICKSGHSFYKSSDCLVCPICEAENQFENDLLSSLSAPARRALKKEGIDTLKKRSSYSEKELLQWHGLGKTSIPKLKALLKAVDLTFKEDY